MKHCISIFISLSITGCAQWFDWGQDHRSKVDPTVFADTTQVTMSPTSTAYPLHSMLWLVEGKTFADTAKLIDMLFNQKNIETSYVLYPMESILKNGEKARYGTAAFYYVNGTSNN